MNQPIRIPETLDELQRDTFDYFVHEVNPLNGLVVDKTEEGVARKHRCRGVGLVGLSMHRVGVTTDHGGFPERSEGSFSGRVRYLATVS